MDRALLFLYQPPLSLVFFEFLGWMIDLGVEMVCTLFSLLMFSRGDGSLV